MKTYLDELYDEVEGMKSVKSPRWIVLARKHLPTLRDLYWNGEGEDKYHAQKLIQELSLQQTLPLNEIGREWIKVKDKWYEADSYTKEWVDQDEVQEGKRSPTVYVDPLPGRIIEEYSTMGLNEDECRAAVAASSYSLDVSEKAWYEEGEMPSVPLLQEEQQDLKIAGKEAYELRLVLQQQVDSIFKFRTAFFEYAVESGLRGTSEIGGRDVWVLAWRSAFDTSRQREDFLHVLKGVSKQFEPQYIARAFLSLQDEDFGIRMIDAKDIKVKHYNLLIFIDEFWHMIDNDLDGTGSQESMTEDEAYKIASGYEREIINSFPVEGKKIEETRPYVQGMFDAIGSESNLKSAGYDNWRAEKSRSGALAYTRTFEAEVANGTGLGKASKIAWSKFWRAVRIIGITKYGLKVRNDANDKEFRLSYNAAISNLNAGTLPLTLSEAVKLRKILKDKGWGSKLEKLL